MAALAKEKTTIRTIIGRSGSRVSISFDAWTSNLDLSLFGVVAHFLSGDMHELKTLLLALPEVKNHSVKEQACVLVGVLNNSVIDVDKLGWFVLSNNDTALFELSKSIPFDPQKERLCCAGHMINLAANVFLYGQDPKDIERQLTQSEVSHLTLWRQRGAVGKLHNLVFHVTRPPRQRASFDKFQEENLALADHDTIYALIRDSGLGWNSTYMMIERAIKLKDSFDQYLYKISKSADESDRSTIPDKLQAKDWESLVGIKLILATFF